MQGENRQALRSVNNIETGRDKADMSGESRKVEQLYLSRLVEHQERVFTIISSPEIVSFL